MLSFSPALLLLVLATLCTSLPTANALWGCNGLLGYFNPFCYFSPGKNATITSNSTPTTPTNDETSLNGGNVTSGGQTSSNRSATASDHEDADATVVSHLPADAERIGKEHGPNASTGAAKSSTKSEKYNTLSGGLKSPLPGFEEGQGEPESKHSDATEEKPGSMHSSDEVNPPGSEAATLPVNEGQLNNKSLEMREDVAPMRPLIPLLNILSLSNCALGDRHA
ncbi:hypothetical protein ERJ75_000990900 [Trypanosoma vivax]|nr:hypothetical protein TRVL_02957 [Trypanosoma vivax]KAH8611781.1 hypothetical protein ERJ75_000990900 [Trypanosoma vivax]